MHVDLVDPGPSVMLNPTRLYKAAKAENVGRDGGRGIVGAGRPGVRKRARRCGTAGRKRDTGGLRLGRLINPPCENINFN